MLQSANCLAQRVCEQLAGAQILNIQVTTFSQARKVHKYSTFKSSTHSSQALHSTFKSSTHSSQARQILNFQVKYSFKSGTQGAQILQVTLNSHSTVKFNSGGRADSSYCSSHRREEEVKEDSPSGAAPARPEP